MAGLRREGPAVDGRDVDELEAHLRDQIAELDAAGLTADEAFLIAVKRMGNLDTLSREFAREHSGRLWKQLVLSGDDEPARPSGGWLGGARLRRCGAPSRSRSPVLLAGFPTSSRRGCCATSACSSCRSSPAYFARRRRARPWRWVLTAAPFVLAALVVNVYPYEEDSGDRGPRENSRRAHLPVVLWFAVAYPYMGGTLRSHERRMDFVRFTGEWVIYYVLIALGGGVLLGSPGLILEPIGVDLDVVASGCCRRAAGRGRDRGGLARSSPSSGWWRTWRRCSP